ncbi:MAG: acyl carrier protein [Candidatus Firestonebacteria bacterium]|nr:acyl carrier protein [Candidatus Firestonebacteria bacterium]
MKNNDLKYIDIEKKIKKILADKSKLPIEEIKLDSLLIDDLGIDSFTAIEILFQIEDIFNIGILEKNFKEMQTVEDIVNYIINNNKLLK